MHSNLPHLDLKYHYQFITFRTNDSIDSFIEKINSANNIPTKDKQYKIDAYLDTSKKGAYLNNEIIEILKEIILEQNNKLYEVEILTIMPNHVHLLIKQLEEITKIMKHIKGKSSIKINQFLNKKGSFWQKGYFDKAIRDEKHYKVVYEYIENNPIKAELKDYEIRTYSRYD